jgi:hypothetical protein
METPFYPFVVPKNRPRITGEPESNGSKHTPLNPGIDWIGFFDRGGGKVPRDLDWPTNPKQYQEENGSGTMPTPPR